jgi:hypothetical protein
MVMTVVARSYAYVATFIDSLGTPGDVAIDQQQKTTVYAGATKLVLSPALRAAGCQEGDATMTSRRRISKSANEHCCRRLPWYNVAVLMVAVPLPQRSPLPMPVLSAQCATSRRPPARPAVMKRTGAPTNSTSSTRALPRIFRRNDHEPG